MHALCQFAISDLCGQLTQFHGKIRVLHLTAKHIRERRSNSSRRTDPEFISWHKKRCEKRKALNVVPVSVAEHNIAAYRLRCIRHQIKSKGARACAAVEYQPLASIGQQLDAQCIAAEMDSRSAGGSNGSPCTPK